MTAPTEAEIRAAIEERFPSSIDHVDEDVHDALRPVIDSDQARSRIGWDPEFFPSKDHPGTLWADLRPSEAEELHDAIYEAIHTAEHDFLLDVRRRVVEATIRFAREHPDIPRGAWRAKVPA